MLEINDVVENLEITLDNGEIKHLHDFEKLILFFYPKDNTPGCSKEACSMNQNYDALRALGYEVIGVSIQDAKSKAKFRLKYELTLPLAIDTELTLNNYFGVYQEKKMCGRTYMGTVRTTYVIENKTITHVYKKVKVATHGEDLLKDLG